MHFCISCVILCDQLEYRISIMVSEIYGMFRNSISIRAARREEVASLHVIIWKDFVN